MPTPYSLEDVSGWSASDLSSLPRAEDQVHEYKSSATKLPDLRAKIGVAASGFWNSGGGVLVIGVDGARHPDGGIPTAVGRQSIRDWVDQALRDVAPAGGYSIAVLQGEPLDVAEDRAVLVIAFGESHLAPHMAPDLRYYIRAGAHTVPAPHFFVEALMARRGLSRPVLRPALRRKAGSPFVAQLGIVAASSASALDVRISLPVPPPRLRRHGEDLTYQVGVVGPGTPFFFDVHRFTTNEGDIPPFPLLLEFADAAGRTFTEEFTVDFGTQLGPILSAESGDHEINQHLNKIELALGKVVGTLHQFETHLRSIANRRR